MLHVRCYENTSDGSEATVWEHKVQHLSPYGLQYLTEEQVERVGRKAIDESHLYKVSPTIYWNTHWYSARLGTPTGFISIGNEANEAALLANESVSSSTHGPFQGPIVVGLNDHTVKARIHHLFSTSGKTCALELADIYPLRSADEMALLQRALVELDGTNNGTKSALFSISEASFLFEKHVDNTAANARVLYETLLTLSHVGNSEILDSSASEMHPLVQLGRPSSLDLNLYETMKCTLASSDFVHMKTTEEDFVGRLPSRVAMAFRAAMGVLV
jgi:hypothetical protein